MLNISPLFPTRHEQEILPEDIVALPGPDSERFPDRTRTSRRVCPVEQPDQPRRAALQSQAVRNRRPDALAAKPPAALAIARRLVRGDRDEIEARIVEEGKLFASQLHSAEAREAFTAFMEKRPPDFAKLRKAG